MGEKRSHDGIGCGSNGSSGGGGGGGGGGGSSNGSSSGGGGGGNSSGSIGGSCIGGDDGSSSCGGSALDGNGIGGGGGGSCIGGALYSCTTTTSNPFLPTVLLLSEFSSGGSGRCGGSDRCGGVLARVGDRVEWCGGRGVLVLRVSGGVEFNWEVRVHLRQGEGEALGGGLVRCLGRGGEVEG